LSDRDNLLAIRANARPKLSFVLIPSASARAMLEGMSACGIARDLVIARGQLPRDELEQRDGVLSFAVLERMWAAAHDLAPRATLPLEVGLRVPYGAFGVLDFLAGTADTVAAALDSLRAYFRWVSQATALEIEPADDRVRVRIVNRRGFDGAAVADAFTVGVLLDRFRSRSEGTFRATVEMAIPTPAEADDFRRIAKTDVRFGGNVSAILVDRASYENRSRNADARLHETLRALAGTLDLGANASELEHAVRARLRTSLRHGGVDASAMGRALGMSARTLHRRLAEIGRSFQQVVDDFRHEEAMRLLDDPRQSLAAIARELGFREQTSFQRAFKRWTGSSPRAVRESRRG
jgi:AraC-like DNA-binding protein